jgi:CDP-4-dehydro-6-deoxyglucose reductase, E1
MIIPLIKSAFYNEANTREKLARFITETRRFSMGDQCMLFENKFKNFQECQHAVFVSSGSAANLILLQALLNIGILKLGDKVGFSALTWATNPMPIIQLGLVPVAIDCEIYTLNVSPLTLQEHLGDIRALFLTNVLGLSDNIAEIQRLCSENSIVLLEDNCESFGSRYKDKLLGNFGLASTFSFFVGHHLSTIEGGMVCTNDNELNNALIMCRAHGWDRNLQNTEQASLREQHRIDNFYAQYTFYDLAYNVRPTEIQGFLGAMQIDYAPNIIAARSNVFAFFQDIIAKKNKTYYSIYTENMSVVSNFAFPIVCIDNNDAIMLKNKFIESGVEIRPIIAGDITQQPFFKKYVPHQQCFNANIVHQNGFYFANNPEITMEEMNYIAALL